MPPSLSRYEVLHPIGDNHYARYFKGYDTVGERDVCIVEFLDKFRRNEERWKEIWQQILGAGRIKHEYVVSVYDYDRDRGQVITELMQGSLRDLPPQSLTNTELVRTVLYRTLEALDYLHSNNHPHGDIRPANLLYDVAGQTKISYSPGISLGGLIPRREKDHAFLAPELFDPSFGEVGVGVDLYGCGMSALSLLLGQEFSQKLLGVAVSDDVNWQRFHRDLNSHPSVRQLLPTLPPDMETVIQKLISKKVDQRFTSIVEARALLMRPAVEVKIQVPDVKPGNEPTRHVAAAPVPFLASTGGRGSSIPESQKKPRPVRDWLNQKLKNPLVMGLVSAFIAAVMVFAMAVISVLKEPSREITISLSSQPPGASVLIDEQPQKGTTDLQLKLPAGKHQLKLNLPGYQAVTQDVEIPSDHAEFTIPKIVLNAIPMTPSKPPKTDPAKIKPPPPPPVNTKWELPPGLELMGSAVNESTGLPLKVSSTKLKSTTREGDVPLSFVLIPKGEYTFGAQSPLQPGEIAARRESLSKPFYISEHELTEAQLFGKRKADGSTAPPAPEARNLPAVMISYTEAADYCRWLGPEFEVPSELEWECAARGTVEREFPWGAQAPTPVAVRMRSLPDQKDGSSSVVSVLELPTGRTPEGISHLLGNTAEWCRDLYSPGEGEDQQTAGTGQLHVIRGGSFRSPKSGPIRVAWRANALDRGHVDIGVRVVCHPLPPKESQP